MKYYAGIGSRETPGLYLDLINTIACALSLAGFTLRSGAADGADTAFEQGALRVPGTPAPEIYVPWKGFNRESSHRRGMSSAGQLALDDISPEAVAIARRNHPNWQQLSQAARWMHSRNVAQALGEDCRTPSEFVLCWTKHGAGRGGTGQAIRVAREANIPVYDMGGLAMPYIRKQLKDKHGVDL